EPREAEARRAESLRDVAGDVNPHEMKTDPFGAGPSQRGQAMADLLETRTEPMTEHLDVVSLRSGRLEKRLIGHEQGGREIVGERDPCHPLGFGGNHRLAGDAIEDGAL